MKPNRQKLWKQGDGLNHYLVTVLEPYRWKHTALVRIERVVHRGDCRHCWDVGEVLPALFRNLHPFRISPSRAKQPSLTEA